MDEWRACLIIAAAHVTETSRAFVKAESVTNIHLRSSEAIHRTKPKGSVFDKHTTKLSQWTRSLHVKDMFLSLGHSFMELKFTEAGVGNTNSSLWC